MYARIAITFVLVSTVLASSCSFDRGGLDRFSPCVDDAQCTSGRCTDGYCVQSDRAPYDGGLDDLFAPDVGADAVEPVDLAGDSDEDPGYVDAPLNDVGEDTIGDAPRDRDVFEPDSDEVTDASPDLPDQADAPDGAADVMECEPNVDFCDEAGDVRQCTATGLAGYVIQPCDFSCAEGECQPNVCGDGFPAPDLNEECDDGNDLACDGCEACARLNVGMMTAATSTTSEVIWTPEGESFTLEGWVNPSSDGALFGIGDTTTVNYAFAQISGGVVVFTLNFGETVIRAEGSTSLTGGWHHVAVQRFATWGAVIFVDGQLEILTHTPQGASAIDGATRLWIGSEGSVAAMNGRIDEVRITHGIRYREHFIPPRRFDHDDQTLALFHMDAGVGSALLDVTGNGRDLTMSGWGWGIDACYGGDENAAACGDGQIAPWEGCDDDSESCSACVPLRNCAGYFDPSGACVRFGPSDKWKNGRDTCRAYGGNMYVIEDEMVNDWLVFLVGLGQSHWIGLNDRDREGTYTWSSGSTAGYRNWASGEPNNDWFREDCVEIYNSSGQWNDEDCGSSRPYVCEIN